MIVINRLKYSDLNRAVIYTDIFAKDTYGVIKSWDDKHINVLFNGDRMGKACDPYNLIFEFAKDPKDGYSDEILKKPLIETGRSHDDHDVVYYCDLILNGERVIRTFESSQEQAYESFIRKLNHSDEYRIVKMLS